MAVMGLWPWKSQLRWIVGCAKIQKRGPENISIKGQERKGPHGGEGIERVGDRRRRV